MRALEMAKAREQLCSRNPDVPSAERMEAVRVAASLARCIVLSCRPIFR
jgi:hypothetical protein